jgi:hypothetical protein
MRVRRIAVFAFPCGLIRDDVDEKNEEGGIDDKPAAEI